MQPVAERRADPAREPDEQRQDGRRDEGQEQREDEDVGGGAPARDEELRLATEQVEQRLREGERPQGAEMQRPQERGRAS
ncbi:MAG TPA: hypothetical protein VFX80_06795 [Solirubrobacteraceae bacterium]|nr:hypothetical protein [Solirubrobacteraceae bacterium]